MYADVTLNQGESSQVSSPEVIASGGLGPCIAIGIFDSGKKIGYMIHEANALHDGNIPAFLDTILEKSKSKNLILYAIGGGMIPKTMDGWEYTNEEIFAARAYAQREIEKRFDPNNVTIEWNDSMSTVELYLDAGAGEFNIEILYPEDFNFEEE